MAVDPGMGAAGFDEIVELGCECGIDGAVEVLFGIVHEGGDVMGYDDAVLFCARDYPRPKINTEFNPPKANALLRQYAISLWRATFAT